jgi:hypothetical protein
MIYDDDVAVGGRRTLGSGRSSSCLEYDGEIKRLLLVRESKGPGDGSNVGDWKGARGRIPWLRLN